MLLIVVSQLCGGCFILDEIEKGRELMRQHSPDTAAEAQVSGADANNGNKTARQRLADYYAKQRAKASAPAASDDPSDMLGSCKIGKKTRFTRRSDCELRGGVFL